MNPLVLPLENISLLIVEDEADNRDLLSFVLHSNGAKVLAVNSGSAALEVLKQLRPDAVLSDLHMPDTDGYSLIRCWRAQEAELGVSPVPFIAVTAYVKEQEQQQALAAGFQLYIAKPFDVERLPQLVATVVAQGVDSTSPKAIQSDF